MSTLIDYLESINLLTFENVSDYIFENDILTLNSLVIYMRDLIEKDYEHSLYTPFVFVPNSDISGAGGCDEISCSIRRAEKFASFAALYADKVYIQLQFITSEHYELIDIDEIIDDIDCTMNFKMKLLKELSLIVTYSELISNSIVIITPSHKMLCPDCFQREVLGNNILDLENLKKAYVSKAKVFLKNFDLKDNSAEISIQNIDEFFPDHDLFWCISNPEEVRQLKKEKVGKIVKNKQFTKEFIEAFIEDEFTSAMYTTKYCNEENAKLITNKLSDSMFLSLNKNDTLLDLKQQKQLLPEYDLLITQNLSIKNIIRLRQEENESFNKFRIALYKAAKEQCNTSNVLDWEQIYDDIIYPELNNLDLKMKQLKNGRLNRFFGTMTVITTALVANKFGNMLMPGLLSNISAFETTIGAAGINFILDKTSTKKAELQNNDFFFLWKLNKTIRK